MTDLKFEATSNMKADATVVRGAPSWSYVYITLGFTVSLVGTFLTMVPPDKLPFPFNVVAFAIAVILLIRLFVFSRRFQDWLIVLETWYEGRSR